MRSFALSLDDSIYVAGHRGLVGSSIVRALRARGFNNLVLASHSELDLTNRPAVDAFFSVKRPAVVILAAARVGGILANSTFPADFIRDNLAIALNVIDACHRHGARKLLNLGSSCIYPKLAAQPIREECLLTGPLEETNRAYAVAKIAAIEMCDHYRKQYGCDFISAMPTNLYGPHDNFDLEGSHVIPALLRKYHEAKLVGGPVTLWGTGTPHREFLYVDDVAEASLLLLEQFSAPGPINVGAGHDLSIRELAQTVADVVGFAGETKWDSSKPDGTPRKLLDISKIRALGFEPKVALREGLARTYSWYVTEGLGRPAGRT